MSKSILAQYTIRSKQDYIFRTNRIVEIMGASVNISKAWKVLFEEAKNCGKIVEQNGNTAFSLEDTERKFKQKEVQMVELFCGGGNETVLFDSLETYREVNQAFSYRIMKDYPGMIPMSEYWEVSGDYKEDYKKLMTRTEARKNVMAPGRNEFILPFSMMDRDTFQPYTDVIKIEGNEKRMTAEGLAKRMAGIRVRDNDPSVKLLDDMVTKKEEEGLLAVVHADGNNMGRKIMDMLGKETSCDVCVEKMRKFTEETKRAFVDKGLEALHKCREDLKRKYSKKNLKDTAFAFREVIADGDDMTFICNARFVMEYVKAYLEAVYHYQSRHRSEWGYSSCAGICIFHSHYPFARAYSLAEQCCDDGAKAMVHKTDINGNAKAEVVEECWVDYHYIHSGIGGNLMAIRHNGGTEDRIARPWRVCGQGSLPRDYNQLEKLAVILKEHKVARNNVKEIGSAWEYSKEDGYKELSRICAHAENLEDERLEDRLRALFPEGEELDREKLLKALYDLSEIYDLWFREVKECLT